MGRKQRHQTVNLPATNGFTMSLAKSALATLIIAGSGKSMHHIRLLSVRKPLQAHRLSCVGSSATFQAVVLSLILANQQRLVPS